MRRRLVKALKSLDAVPIENSVAKGTPDVNYLFGWIELKWLRAWPLRPTTPVRIDHFTKEQRLWLRRREFRGGNAFLLLQCRKEWLLLSGTVAAEVVGHSTKEELIAHSILYLPLFDSVKLKEKLCISPNQRPTSLSAEDLASPKLNTQT